MTDIAKPSGRLVAEDLYAIPDDGKKYELLNGELLVSEPPFAWHGVLQARLAAALLAFAKPRRLGAVMTESGYVLRRTPDTVRGPDVAFVRAERLLSPDSRDRFIEGGPDLVAEIVSDGDTPSEIAEKVQGYVASGTRLVWVLYPRRKQAIVHRASGIATPLWEEDSLEGGDVLPGFTMPLAELFADDWG